MQRGWREMSDGMSHEAHRSLDEDVEGLSDKAYVNQMTGTTLLYRATYFKSILREVM